MSMTLSELLQQRRVAAEPTTKQELENLRALATRNLQDAALPGLSTDGKFGMAYNAARTPGTTLLKPEADHTFLALETALGPSSATLVGYLDSCRIKRNELSYDAANLIGESDANELVEKAEELRDLVEHWIAQNHPNLI